MLLFDAPPWGITRGRSLMNASRRNLFKMGGMALAMIPVVAIAAKNDSIRTSMRYKDSPEGEKKCANCKPDS